jgi:hypothetical protein
VRDWDALEREEERIRVARREAVELLARTSAKLARLDKQQEFLRRRGRDMLRRGLKTMDELDEVEEKEKTEAAQRASAEAAQAAENERQAVIDSLLDPCFGFSSVALPWAGPIPSGGNPEGDPGSP